MSMSSKSCSMARHSRISLLWVVKALICQVIPIHSLNFQCPISCSKVRPLKSWRDCENPSYARLGLARAALALRILSHQVCLGSPHPLSADGANPNPNSREDKVKPCGCGYWIQTHITMCIACRKAEEGG